MATLPDGTNVTSQFGPEGWESIGETFASQFGPEGWEDPISLPDTPNFSEDWEEAIPIDVLTFSMTPSNPSLTGTTVTVSGSLQSPAGAARNGVTVTIELIDSGGNVLSTETTTTDADGDYSRDIVLRDKDTAFIRATSDRAGARVGSQPIAFGAGRVEGWEN